jgi:hypothetical protein
MSNVVARIPERVHIEARRIAAIRGEQPADVLLQAWVEYLENHRQEFAADLESAAEVLRNGTLDDAAAFVNRGARERAKAAAAAAKS